MGVASYDVSTRAVWAIVALLERANLPSATLFDELPFDADSLKGRRRISWDDYVTICENAFEIVGDWPRLDELIEDSYHEVLPEFRAIARTFIEPKLFVRFVLEVVDPMVWPAMHFECTDLGGSDVRLAVHLRPGARPNPILMRVNIAALRGITRHLDLPPAKILHSECGPSHGIYDFRIPASGTLVNRARRASREMINRMTMSLLFGDGTMPDPLESRLDDSTVTWQLSRRQIEVLRLIVQGQANKEIASKLDCAENTVELHVTQLLRKAKVSSRAQLIARFWQDAAQ